MRKEYTMRSNMLIVLTILCGLNLLAGPEISASIYCEPLWGPEGVQLSFREDAPWIEPEYPRMVHDGAGGAFYAWRGSNDDNIDHLYMQRIDAGGLVKWPANGIDISHQSTGGTAFISLTPDGSGGVIACWSYEFDSYMQRLDANGVEQWGTGGVIAATAGAVPLSAPFPRITMDGSGGAILIYKLYQVVSFEPYATSTSIRMQRIDEYGVRQWGFGILLDASPDNTSHGAIDIISDGAGGAIYAYETETSHYIRVGRRDNAGTSLWAEYIAQNSADDLTGLMIVDDGSGGAIVSWAAKESDIYTLRAQRFSADGTAMWTTGGEDVVTGTIESNSNQIASDGSGGAIITWTDNRFIAVDDLGLNIFAQRFDGTGVAQWTPGGNAVCVSSGDQTEPCITESGGKGAVISWTDARDTETDIYAQRLDSLGAEQWIPCGIAVCSEVYDQNYPLITGDEAGGAIVTWVDYRLMETDYLEIYSQRIDVSGTEQWAAGGQIVCEYCEYSDTRARNIVCATDGEEGAIILWNGVKDGIYTNGIYMQRADSMGSLLWEESGITVCPNDWQVDYPRIIPVNSGGVIAVWQDLRDDIWDIYAQQVDASGLEVWAPDDIAICTAQGEQKNPQLTTDGEGGAIIVWQDSRDDDLDVYVQRVDTGGSIQWDLIGIGVCTATGDQQEIQIISDGSGGAILVWTDGRDSELDIYAQRVDAAGAAQWTVGGTPICTESGDQQHPRIISDGAGGAIFTWADGRGSDYRNDIYAHRINADGSLLWDIDGVAVCTASGDQSRFDIATDGDGGVIVTWSDGRTSALCKYVQSLKSDGSIRWIPDGIRLSYSYFPDFPDIAADGTGGAIVVWGTSNVMAQHVDSSGACLWDIGGEIVAISDAVGGHSIAQDGSGGALIAWNNALLDAPFGQRVRDRVNPHMASILFVDQDAVGTGDGSSWENAFTDLKAALDTVNMSYDIDEIWVAEGSYKPHDGYDREQSFHISNATIEIYGGFAGTETERLERDFEAHVTELSGNIGDLNISSDNSYQVVTTTGTVSSTVLDGFVITGGNGEYGAGLYARSALTLKNCVFRDNESSGRGGGLYLSTGGYVPISNVTFIDNSAEDGGGMFSRANVQMIDVTFTGNTASNYGGGMYCYDDTSPGGEEFVHSGGAFTGNSAVAGGGAYIYSVDGYVHFTNVEFRGNIASSSGGGLYTTGSNDQRIYNCVFFENSSTGNGAGIVNQTHTVMSVVNSTFSKNAGSTCIYNGQVEFALINSVIWDNEVPSNSSIYSTSVFSDINISYSLVEDCWIEVVEDSVEWNEEYGKDGGNNLDEDPLFANSAEGYLQLLPGSPAIDAGDSTVLGLPATDILGNPRITGETIDMGAYEGTVSIIEVTIITDPPIFNVTVAGSTYDSPYTFSSVSGTEIEIGVISPQFYKGDDYFFVAWSDGGDTSHVVTLPDTNVTFTVYFSDVITDDEVGQVPRVNVLHQNHPNPFNPSTTISFSLCDRGAVSLVIYDVAGRLVNVLVDDVMDAGTHDVTWDGRGNAGRTVASGVYFYRLSAGSFNETRKMVLLR